MERIKNNCLRAVPAVLLMILLPAVANAFCFDEAGRAFGINPQLLRSIAKTESNLKPGAVNRNSNGSTDMGLMQINSSWIHGMKLDSDRLLSDPCYNVMTGAKIMKLCIDRYGYAWEAVGCYNAVSMDKKVNYSWKIFNALKAEGKRQKAEAGQQTAGSGLKSPDSKLQAQNPSLSFSVRDKSGSE